MFTSSVTVTLLLLLAFCLFMLVRNQFVYEERILMNRVIFDQQDYRHYLRIKDTISHDNMMWCFWIWPVSKMWPEELQKIRKSDD